MTTPPFSQPASSGTPSIQVPTGVGVVSTLCWVVGILTILVYLAVGIAAIAAGRGLPLVIVNIIAGGAVCVAAFLIRRQERVSVVMLLLAWALPTGFAVLNHESARGSFGPLLLLLLAGVNWKDFR